MSRSAAIGRIAESHDGVFRSACMWIGCGFISNEVWVAFRLRRREHPGMIPLRALSVRCCRDRRAFTLIDYWW